MGIWIETYYIGLTILGKLGYLSNNKKIKKIPKFIEVNIISNHFIFEMVVQN
jgi:hypothetical protein